MKAPNYRTIFDEVTKKLDSAHEFVIDRKEIRKQVKACSRFSDAVFASIVLICLLKQSPDTRSKKRIYTALMNCISRIKRDQSAFLSCLLSKMSDSTVMNMVWTQNYVLRIHFEFDESAHLDRLAELRKQGLSDSFDRLLELGRYAPRTSKLPKIFQVLRKKRRSGGVLVSQVA
jgi:hypothetical protein